MSDITPAMVKELRERTGAGMMDCKKALTEAKGDITVAEELIAKSGHKKVAKSAGRVAAEGKVVIATAANNAIMIEINCETDFVARDESFIHFTQLVVEAAQKNQCTVLDELIHAPVNGTTVDQARQQLIARIGENIQIRRIHVMNGTASQRIGSYIHLGRIGALVLLEGGDDALAKDLAMHAAAMKPNYLNIDSVPAEVKDKEREIQMEIAQKSGKPQNIIEKIVEGQLNKRFSEICFLNQAFFKDPDITITQLLGQNKAHIVSFVRFELGEGIEVVKKSFEEEVNAARGMS